MATSSPIDVIADMDVLSFVALAEVVARTSRRRKYESAWTAMVAAQGTKESMEKLTKPWNQAPTKTADHLLQDLKIGRGGSV